MAEGELTLPLKNWKYEEQLKSTIAELWKFTKAIEWAKTCSLQEKLLNLKWDSRVCDIFDVRLFHQLSLSS